MRPRRAGPPASPRVRPWNTSDTAERTAVGSARPAKASRTPYSKGPWHEREQRYERKHVNERGHSKGRCDGHCAGRHAEIHRQSGTGRRHPSPLIRGRGRGGGRRLRQNLHHDPPHHHPHRPRHQSREDSGPDLHTQSRLRTAFARFRCRDAQPGRTWYARRLPQTGSLHL